jgi:hypothetical protein
MTATTNRTKKLPVVRAYRLENRANVGKAERVAAVAPEYQAAAKVIEANQMRAFVQHGEKFWNRREPGLAPGTAETLRRAKERPATPRPTTDGLVRQPGERGRGKRRLVNYLRLKAEASSLAD